MHPPLSLSLCLLSPLLHTPPFHAFPFSSPFRRPQNTCSPARPQDTPNPHAHCDLSYWLVQTGKRGRGKGNEGEKKKTRERTEARPMHSMVPAFCRFLLIFFLAFSSFLPSLILLLFSCCGFCLCSGDPPSRDSLRLCFPSGPSFIPSLSHPLVLSFRSSSPVWPGLLSSHVLAARRLRHRSRHRTPNTQYPDPVKPPCCRAASQVKRSRGKGKVPPCLCLSPLPIKEPLN